MRLMQWLGAKPGWREWLAEVNRIKAASGNIANAGDTYWRNLFSVGHSPRTAVETERDHLKQSRNTTRPVPRPWEPQGCDYDQPHEERTKCDVT